MPPPMMSVLTFVRRLFTTASLSETFAPPRMATNGRTGLFTALPRNAISFSMRKPATEVPMYLVMTAVEAWARWAVPNASLQ